MVARNPRPESFTGVSPQFYGDQARTRENLEARSQVEDLQKKQRPASDTPAEAQLWFFRDEGFGGRYTTGSASRTSGQPDIELPGTGFRLPPLYKGERLSVEVLLGQMTTSGGTHVTVEFLGKVKGSGTESVIARTKETPPLLTTPAPYVTYLLATLADSVTDGRVRVLIGSDGGTISVDAGTGTLQRWNLRVPRAT